MRSGGGAYYLRTKTIYTVGRQQHFSNIGCQSGAQDGSHIARIGQSIKDQQRRTRPGRTARARSLWCKGAKRQNADYALRSLYFAYRLYDALAHLNQAIAGQPCTVEQTVQQRTSLYRAFDQRGLVVDFRRYNGAIEQDFQQVRPLH